MQKNASYLSIMKLFNRFQQKKKQLNKNYLNILIILRLCHSKSS